MYALDLGSAVHVRNGLVAHTSFYPVPERCEFAHFRELNGFGQ